MIIETVAKESPYLFAFLNLLIGAFIGNRLSIDRDRKNDFDNEAIPIIVELNSQIELIKVKNTNDGLTTIRGVPIKIAKEKLLKLELMIGVLNKKKYKKAVLSYLDCFSGRRPDINGIYDDVIINDDYEKLHLCIKNLIKCCKY